jgi:hypothetical protein
VKTGKRKKHNGTFGQKLNLATSGKAETGAAGEQPARNNKAAHPTGAALPLSHFYRNA